MADKPNPEHDADLIEATRLTSANIRQLLKQQQESGDPAVSLLSVPERNELIEEVARIMPAGNLVNFVFSGILNARERSVADPQTGRSHINALFKGLSLMKDDFVSRLAFAGPAGVLSAYNMMLRLAGADPNDFLPEGAWQFYVEFGLREDAARHQNETVAFQAILRQQPQTEVFALSAWVLASASLLYDYEGLLLAIWEENTRLKIIEETTGLTGMFRQWQQIRPYAAPDMYTSLLEYRQNTFEKFCNHHLSGVSKTQWQAFSQLWYDPQNQESRGRQARAYMRQLSIYRHLEPGEYSDDRYPLTQDELHIAVVWHGSYFLIPLKISFDLARVVPAVQAILNTPPQSAAAVDGILALAPRSAQVRLRSTLDTDQRADLERLRRAPIIINWDKTPAAQPLSDIRTGKRGIGDHALTIFRTDASTVFDFSHIFFDGPWAMATAEILTNEAIRQLYRLQDRPQPETQQTARPLNLSINPKFTKAAERQTYKVNHISAEVSRPLAPLQETRKALAARTRIRLTINDLLVLYRTMFNLAYQPSRAVILALDELKQEPRGAALHRQIMDMFAAQKQSNPSLLIPIDATQSNPKERIYPTTFRSPLVDFYSEHQQLMLLYEQARQKRLFRSNRDAIDAFIIHRQDYLAYLKTFAAIMQRYRDIAIEGESISTTAIRLIAGLPKAMQQLMDDIPAHFSIVNEAIKGEEVFSNVGRVVKGSSITRFASAKDDNNKKTLVWGMMTNDQDVLTITLREFRPAVLLVFKEGYAEVAHLITHDFLSAYVAGLYTFAEDIANVVTASTR